MTEISTSAQPQRPATEASWQFQHLAPKARWGMWLASSLAFGFLLLAVIPLTLGLARFHDGVFGYPLLWSAVFLIVLSIALGFFYSRLQWRHTQYALTAQGLRIRRGVWWRTDTIVARSRVQHTDLHRGPIDRALGLAGLRVYTAGSELMRVTLSGLSAEQAEKIRDALIWVEGDDA